MGTAPARQRRHDALPPNLPPIAIGREEAAALVGVSPTLFDALVADGRMPKARMINRLRRWLVPELDRALFRLPVEGGGEPGEVAEDDDWRLRIRVKA